MARLWSRLRKKARRLGDDMERYQEAITFAEAGEAGHAAALLEEEASEERPGRLVVVGQESHFSEDVKQYALEMAQRLSYEIVALNTAPLSCETFQRCTQPRDEVLAHFKTASRQSAEAFRRQAEEMGISFTHMVKFLDPDRAIQELSHELGGIDFVISEAEEDRPARSPEEREEVRQNIFVYSMV